MSRWSTAKFKIYCIEEYRQKHGMTAPDTVQLFDRFGVFDFMSLPAMQWQPWRMPFWTSRNISRLVLEPHHQDPTTIERGVQEIHAQISASTMKPMLEMDSENTASELFAKSVFIILAPKVK